MGRPSWLAQDLYERGLNCDLIKSVDAAMMKEGYQTRALLACIPLASFTDAYLKSIGIESAVARRVLYLVRLESTWLGEQLATKGVNPTCAELCENVIITKFDCSTKESFAALLPSDLSDGSLGRFQIVARRTMKCLRELHRDVNAVVAQKTEEVHPVQEVQKVQTKADRVEPNTAPVPVAPDSTVTTSAEPVTPTSEMTQGASPVPPTAPVVTLTAAVPVESQSAGAEPAASCDAQVTGVPCTSLPGADQGDLSDQVDQGDLTHRADAAQCGEGDSVTESGDDGEKSDANRDSGTWEHL